MAQYNIAPFFLWKKSHTIDEWDCFHLNAKHIEKEELRNC